MREGARYKALAEGLGLGWLQSRAGTLTCNDVVQAELGLDIAQMSLAQALSQLTHASLEDVIRCLESAPLGEPVSQVLGRARVTVGCDADGPWACVHRLAKAGSEDLAASLSHEMANALGAVIGWASLARRFADQLGAERLGADPTCEQLQEAIGQVESGAEYAQLMARQWSRVARSHTHAGPDCCDAAEVVDDVSRLLRLKAEAAGVQLHTTVTHALIVRAERGTLTTIAWNLAQNAIEATPRGGRVRLSVRRSGEHACLDVIDEGTGMSPSLRARVFEPYFTTKPQGTGLGLALVKQNIDALGGCISVEPADGDRGSHFRVELPLEGTRRRRAPRPSGFQPIPGATRLMGQRIAVIEDDQAMRSLVRTGLELKGATIATASSVDEAHALCGPFDVLVLDANLVDQDGLQLIPDLRVRFPGAPILCVSGAPVRQDDTPATPDAWLRKPFQVDELVKAVDGLLAPAVVASSAE